MSPLEQKYRRLLRLYPAQYRETYEDEMVGVLMSTAAPGQRRPNLRDGLDLLRGATLVRLRHLSGDEDWHDAAAIVSIVMSVVLCLGMAATLIVGTTVFLVWPVVAGALLLGRKRAAAAGAWVGVILLLAISFGAGSPYVLWLVLAVLAAAATSWSASGRRGHELLGRGRMIALACGVALIGLAEINEFNFGMRYFSQERFEGTYAAAQTWLLLGAGLVLLAAGAFPLARPDQRRASLLLAVPVALVAWRSVVEIMSVGIIGATPATRDLLGVLVPAVVFSTVLIYTAVVERQGQGGRRHVSHHGVPLIR